MKYGSGPSSMYTYKVNIKSRTEIKKNKLSWIFLYGICLVTIVFDININDPFNVPKLITLILIASWLLIDVVITLIVSPVKLKSFQFKVINIVVLFVITQFILVFFSPNISIALFGETQRRNGFFTYFALGIIFVYSMLKINFLNLTVLLRMFLFTGLIVGIYGLIQATGNDWVSWENPYNAAITTLGNPNFTSAFLALIFVACVTILLSNQFKAPIQTLAIILIPISLYLIGSSDSRQGYYALTLGIFFYLIMQVFIKKMRLRFILLISTLVMFATAIAGMLQVGPLADILYKQSVSVRGYYWRAAFEMLVNNPITGVGLDSYGLYFRKFKEVGYVRNYGIEITSNNAHNTFLQFFATGGLFLGISYMVIVFMTFIIGLKAIRKSTDIHQQRFLLILMSIYVTFQSQSLISIDNLGLTIWAWVFGGCIIGLSNSIMTSDKKDKNTNQEVSFSQKYRRLILIKPIISYLTILPVLFCCVLLYRPESEMFILRGLVNPAAAQNKNEVLEYSYKIINNSFADPFLKLKAVLYLADMGFTSEASANLKQLLLTDPDRFELLWAQAFFQKQNNLINDEIITRNKIQEVDRYNTKNLLELVRIYISQEQISKAKIYQSLISDISPNSADSQDAKKLFVSK
jgi:O-antigen ligase